MSEPTMVSVGAGEATDGTSTGAERGQPVTGNRLVDQALTEVAALDELPLAEHHDRLSAAQDVLAGVLDSSRQAVQTPIPGVLRPGATRG